MRLTGTKSKCNVKKCQAHYYSLQVHCSVQQVKFVIQYKWIWSANQNRLFKQNEIMMNRVKKHKQKKTKFSRKMPIEISKSLILQNTVYIDYFKFSCLNGVLLELYKKIYSVR